jgi:hypothetical protein
VAQLLVQSGANIEAQDKVKPQTSCIFFKIISWILCFKFEKTFLNEYGRIRGLLF